jgi:hypothetical protein
MPLSLRWELIDNSIGGWDNYMELWTRIYITFHNNPSLSLSLYTYILWICRTVNIVSEGEKRTYTLS